MKGPKYFFSIHPKFHQIDSSTASNSPIELRQIDSSTASNSPIESHQIDSSTASNSPIELKLKSQKFNKFSFAISNILKCCSIFELNNAFLFYSDIFASIIDKEEIQQRDKLLDKVGLKFENSIILINDPKRWKEVSMIERSEIQMPSTTNSLEAFHGQLNS